MRQKWDRKDTGQQPHGREEAAPTATFIAQHHGMGAARHDNTPPSPDKPNARTEKGHPPDSDHIATSVAQPTTVHMHGPHTSNGSTTHARRATRGVNYSRWSLCPHTPSSVAATTTVGTVSCSIQQNKGPEPSSHRPRTPRANRNVPASLEVVEICQVVGRRQGCCLLLVRQRAQERQCQYLHVEGARGKQGTGGGAADDGRPGKKSSTPPPGATPPDDRRAGVEADTGRGRRAPDGSSGKPDAEGRRCRGRARVWASADTQPPRGR